MCFAAADRAAPQLGQKAIVGTTRWHSGTASRADLMLGALDQKRVVDDKPDIQKQGHGGEAEARHVEDQVLDDESGHA